MECNEARQHLDAFLEQALSADLEQAVEEHVNNCDACWQELTMLRDLLTDLNDPDLQAMVLAEPSPLPDDFTAQVMMRIEAEQPRGVNIVWPWLRNRWSRRQYASVAYAMSATAVVISAGNALFLWNQTTNALGEWSTQAATYWDAIQAGVGGGMGYLGSLWYGLLQILHLA